MVLIGSDEAGKGPVLGSMFVAAVSAPSSYSFPDGVADSKTLTDDMRERLFEELTADAAVGTAVVEVPVEQIDAPNTDMNTLTRDAHIDVIQQLLDEADPSPADVVADAADTNTDRFEAILTEHLTANSGLTVTAEHNADETRSVVSAASIIAKTHRETHMKTLAGNYDTPIGSGYPSDPVTNSFLKEYITTHNHAPACARTSWDTTQTLLQNHAQQTFDEY